MFKNTRTTEQFLSDKKKGQEAESTFMEHIALMGGAAWSIGAVPTDSQSTPKFIRPHQTSETGYCYSVAPDIGFSLPNQPKGFASVAQVKIKKLHRDISKEWFYVYLDEKELHRMKVAAIHFNVFFVINIKELEKVNGFSDWLWVNLDDLQERKVTLLKRRICDKPTFLLPLNLFTPLSEITKRPINEPANTDIAPTTSTI